MAFSRGDASLRSTLRTRQVIALCRCIRLSLSLQNTISLHLLKHLDPILDLLLLISQLANFFVHVFDVGLTL